MSGRAGGGEEEQGNRAGALAELKSVRMGPDAPLMPPHPIGPLHLIAPHTLVEGCQSPRAMPPSESAGNAPS